ncbi:MAG: DNA polymerase IV, partial [Alphaproteobacteria bacterium]
ILHFHIPDFPIAVARVVDPGLRGRPVAIVPATSRRALLQAVSGEARAEGIWTGMPLETALRRCPRLHLLAPAPELLTRAGRAVWELTAGYAPVREPAGQGRIYLDASGCSRLLGPGRDLAMRLERELHKRLRLDGSIGVAGNKMTALIAAGYLRRTGVCDILPGSEAAFLAPLPVRQLPGVGRRRFDLLDELGLVRIGDIAALELSRLALLFGGFAPLLQLRARGIDPSPVCPPRRKPALAAETTLPRASNEMLLLRAELCRLVEQLGLELRRRGTGCRRIELRLVYADGVERRGQLGCDDAAETDDELLALTDRLFERLNERRVQLRSLRLRLLELGGAIQPGLFGDRDGPRGAFRNSRALQQAIDQLRHRFGDRAVRRGRGMVVVNKNASVAPSPGGRGPGGGGSQ